MEQKDTIFDSSFEKKNKEQEAIIIMPLGNAGGS